MTNIRTWQDVFWPDVSQPKKAHDAVDQGFWVAAFIAGFTGVITWLGIFPQTAWIDTGLFVAITIGIRFRLRSAAVAGLALFVVERLTSIPTNGASLIVVLCCLLAFIHAVRGTFALRKFSANGTASPEIRTIPPLRKMDVIACLFFLAIFPLIFFVSPGNDRQDFIKTIREGAGIQTNEGNLKEVKEPAAITMTGGSKITVPGNWQILKNADYPDAPKDAVLLELQNGSMWAMFQEEFKEPIQRDFVGEITLEKYAKAVSYVIIADLKQADVSTPLPLTLQGKRCLRFNIKDIREKFRFHHQVTVCDFGDAFLRATVWTSESKFEEQHNEVEKLMSGIHW